jgi:hypothetical protein
MGLYQSLNSPHLAIPGKQAGPAQAYILGLRGSGGMAVFVYLYLAQAGDCAVYVSGKKPVQKAPEFQSLESEAMAFVESMGFMMDNLNFRQLSKEGQAELLRSLPVFRKEPPKAKAASSAEGDAADLRSFGKFLSSF